MKKIFSIIVMAAMFAAALTSCNKENGSDNGGDGDSGTVVTLPESLQGSEYFVMQLGAEEYDAIKSKVSVDMRPYKIAGSDADGIAMYVWEGTYVGGTCAGLNSNGFTDEWLTLVVTSVGWSGAAYNLTTEGLADRASDWAKFKGIAGNESKWYFHFAYKSEQAASHVGQLHWAGGAYNFVFGDPNGTFNDNVENRILPVGGEYKSGEWNEYEICLKDTPIDFSADATSENIFVFLSGGATGTTLDLDAIYFYKK